MKRLQIYLEESQDQQLEILSKTLGVSKARIIREGIDKILQHKTEKVKDPLLELIGLCDSPKGPRDASIHHDKYLYGKRR